LISESLFFWMCGCLSPSPRSTGVAHLKRPPPHIVVEHALSGLGGSTSVADSFTRTGKPPYSAMKVPTIRWCALRSKALPHRS